MTRPLRAALRVGLAGFALGWLLVAMSRLLFPALGLPPTALRGLAIGLAVAWLLGVFVAWRRAGRAAPHASRVADASGRTSVERRVDQATVVLLLAALSLALLQQFLAPFAREREAAAADAAAAAARAASAGAGTGESAGAASGADGSSALAGAAAPAGPPRPVDPHSIAVLPFADLSPERSDAYFADGLAEELLNVIARIDGMKVTSRTSSFLFRDATVDAPAIAARLGVAHLLQGSVRRQGEDVRITVQLVEGADGRQLWSQTYDRRLQDIFQVQQDISQRVADSLAATLGGRKVRVAAPTDDLQAYEEYLRGRQLFVQRGANLAAARGLLEQAVARDPRFADAWAALAGTWYVWPSYAPAPAAVDTLQEADAAAARALALDPGHAGALAVRARIAADRGERLREAELIGQALKRDPNNANTWLWKGLGQYENGHVAAARASFVQAQRLDPLSGLHVGWLAITTEGDAGDGMLRQSHALGWRGPASRARFLQAAAAGTDTGDALLAWLHDDDAIPAAQRDLVRPLVAALATPGGDAAARQALRDAATAHPEWDWTLLLTAFGLVDEAMAAALAAPDTSQALQLSMWMPGMAAFRAHPRFVELAQRDGLVAYWRVHGAPDGCRFADAPPALDCEPPAAP